MKRRLLAMVEFLRALPTSARLLVVELGPEDVIVIEAEVWLTNEQKRCLAEVTQSVWPGRKVCLLDPGLKLSATRAVGGGRSLIDVLDEVPVVE